MTKFCIKNKTAPSKSTQYVFGHVLSNKHSSSDAVIEASKEPLGNTDTREVLKVKWLSQLSITIKPMFLLLLKNIPVGN